MLTALAGFAILFVLLFLGLPIGFGMMLVGVGGFAYLVAWGPALALLGQTAFDTVLTYSLSVVPLFILMGKLITEARLSDELYRACYAFLGRWRGGLAMATVAACGGFSAVCGSSLATAATMAKVAVPSMRQYGYADSLAAGSIAAGGTLGILIPPSVILVLYGIMTENDIGALFIGGILPGLLGVLLYILAVATTTAFNPETGPPGEDVAWPERLAALSRIWAIMLLFLVVIGGIYLGVFTPTEAAGVGAGGAFLFALARRALTWRILIDVLVDTARTTSMLFIVLIGALMFSNFINVAGFPAALSGWLDAAAWPPLTVLFAIMAIYVVLGCVLESLSMMLLTVPIFYPIIVGLGFDPIWFGILVVVVIEISLITPPIGLNVFVIKAVLPDVPTGSIFRGVIPFILADLVRLAIIIFVPGLVLFLPGLMA